MYKDPVKPGEPLGYKSVLDNLNNPEQSRPERMNVTARPRLLIPVDAQDTGDRPLGEPQARYSTGVYLIDENSGQTVIAPRPGVSYRLCATVQNLGSAPARGGLCDFYVAPGATLDGAITDTSAAPRPIARTGFPTLPPYERITVRSPRPWTPRVGEWEHGILACAYDILTDRYSHPFDPYKDRHVGRRDWVPDFSGDWSGVEQVPNMSRTRRACRVVIAQAGLTITGSFFTEVDGVIPQQPLNQGLSTIRGKTAVISTQYSVPGGKPIVETTYTLTLTNPATLHVDEVWRVMYPGHPLSTYLQLQGNLYRAIPSPVTVPWPAHWRLGDPAVVIPGA